MVQEPVRQLIAPDLARAGTRDISGADRHEGVDQPPDRLQEQIPDLPEGFLNAPVDPLKNQP